MVYARMLKEINDSFQEKRVMFSKDDKAFLSGRDNRYGRMQGIFTRDYWKRDELFNLGEIFYCYTFKMYISEMNLEKPYPTWILFSPHRILQENPVFYRDIVNKMRDVLTKKRLSRKEKIIANIFKSNYEEPKYVEIPEPYNLGHLCYLSTSYVKPNHFNEFHLGINLVVASKNISKEIEYLPEIYWNDEYKEVYYVKECLHNLNEDE